MDILTRRNQRQRMPSSKYRTRSASSSSANPDEDWTKISDPAERRRIQNRIAQRNYRRKLKRRLEELERRATFLDAPSSCGNEKPSPSTNTQSTQAFKVQSQSSPTLVPALRGQYTPPIHDDDEYPFPASGGERGWSYTPPTFAYQAPPEHRTMLLYGDVQGYLPMPTEICLECLSSVPVSVGLPLMTHFSDAIKQETVDEVLPPYLSYSGYPLPGVDLSAGQPSLCDQMPHVSATSLRSPAPITSL